MTTKAKNEEDREGKMNRFGWLLQSAIEKKLPGLPVALASSVPLHLSSPSIARLRKDSMWGLQDKENYPIWEEQK